MNEVYTIRSEEGDKYFHIIARKRHLVYADMISAGIQKDFGKPADE